MKTIEVTFDENGEPKVETTGFSGGACKPTTKDLEDKLGSVVKDTKKAEFQGGAQQQDRRVAQ